jgi:tripeptide aminopeptidase
MFEKYSYTVKERFLRYVKIDTQSDPLSETFPSTEKQKDLLSLLAKELKEIGLEDAHTDEWGYVYATLPSNTDKEVPVICFCSHADTAPDCSGTNVNPQIHENYQGNDISYINNAELVLKPSESTHLQNKIGHDIITTDGTTLLGSDDKSGVACIMDAIHFLVNNPEVKHGTIKVLFTPDEEVGRGVEQVDVQKLGAQFGYTLDSGDLGWFEDETFSADGVKVTVHGISTHPGYAKDKMVNAMRVAGHIIARLPLNRLSPESTENKEGFIHLVRMGGVLEKAELDFIIRDFEDELLLSHEEELRQICEEVINEFPGATMEFAVYEQYRNMKKVLDQYPQVSEYARLAIERAGLTVTQKPIRGGTDGSRLSYMGLPCPNIFAGEQEIHSLKEWVSVQDMQKAVQTIAHLCQIWEERS